MFKRIREPSHQGLSIGDGDIHNVTGRMSEGLNVIVLVKQVPEIEKVRFDREKGRLDRGSAGAVVNPFDLHALETAVRIRESAGGKVTALSMGPKKAEESLRDVLARGADRAVLLTDARFAGADTLATSYTLSIAIQKLGAFDLIVCGEKTVDGDTAQVGPEVAEFLDIPHVAYVEEIREIWESGIVVRSKTGKHYLLVELEFPALITVTKDINTPRLPTLKDKLKSRKAAITAWGAQDLSEAGGTDFFGLSGSPTWVANVYAPHSGERKGQTIRGTPEVAARKIADILGSLIVPR